MWTNGQERKGENADRLSKYFVILLSSHILSVVIRWSVAIAGLIAVMKFDYKWDKFNNKLDTTTFTIDVMCRWMMNSIMSTV